MRVPDAPADIVDGWVPIAPGDEVAAQLADQFVGIPPAVVLALAAAELLAIAQGVLNQVAVDHTLFFCIVVGEALQAVASAVLGGGACGVGDQAAVDVALEGGGVEDVWGVAGA
jgi:hypothetical protein